MIRVQKQAVTLLIVLSLVIAGCSGEATIEPSPTAYPTYTPPPVEPSSTPYPTYTPYPTFTPYPTYTPYPTWTPQPTATSTSTSTPTATPTATATATPKPVVAATPLPPATQAPKLAEGLLNTMITTRMAMEELGGMIDSALRTGGISCLAVVDVYNRVVSAPEYDVSKSAPEVQSAYDSYRQAIAYFGNIAGPMAENCRTILQNPEGSGTITHLQWSTARRGVNEAVAIIAPGTQLLQQYLAAQQ